MYQSLFSFLVAATLASGLARPATAEEMVSIKPGVMCASADALSRLTLPNGESRTHMTSPHPEDINAAAVGGCIDIPLGLRVQVQQAFRNTSRVTYAGPGASPTGIMTVPNVDFRTDGSSPLASAEGGIPAGLKVAQHLPAGGGMTLVLLEDSRITPAIIDAVGGSGGDPDVGLDDNPRLRAELTARPLRNGALLLETGQGQVIGRIMFEYPFASIKPAPFHGLPVPTFLLEINESAGTGSSGPLTQLLAPMQSGLTPVQATPLSGGPSEALMLSSTIRSMWRIVPARKGGTEEIEEAWCQFVSENNRPGYLRTYRFEGGRWTSATRIHGGDCVELEAFPDRRLFP